MQVPTKPPLLMSTTARFDLLDFTTKPIQEETPEQVAHELLQEEEAEEEAKHIKYKPLHTCYYTTDANTASWLKIMSTHLAPMTAKRDDPIDKMRDTVLLLASLAFYSRYPEEISMVDQPWFGAPDVAGDGDGGGSMHYYNCPITAFVQWMLWLSYRVWRCALVVLDVSDKPALESVDREFCKHDTIYSYTRDCARVWLWYFEYFGSNNRCYAINNRKQNKYYAAYALDLMAAMAQCLLATNPVLVEKEQDAKTRVQLIKAIRQSRSMIEYQRMSSANQDHPWVISERVGKALESIFYARVAEEYSRLNVHADAEWAYRKAQGILPGFNRRVYWEKTEEFRKRREALQAQPLKGDPFDFHNKYMAGASDAVPQLSQSGQISALVLFDILFRPLEGVYINLDWLPALRLDLVPVLP